MVSEGWKHRCRSLPWKSCTPTMPKIQKSREATATTYFIFFSAWKMVRVMVATAGWKAGHNYEECQMDEAQREKSGRQLVSSARKACLEAQEAGMDAMWRVIEQVAHEFHIGAVGMALKAQTRGKAQWEHELPKVNSGKLGRGSPGAEGHLQEEAPTAAPPHTHASGSWCGCGNQAGIDGSSRGRKPPGFPG